MYMSSARFHTPDFLRDSTSSTLKTRVGYSSTTNPCPRMLCSTWIAGLLRGCFLEFLGIALAHYADQMVAPRVHRCHFFLMISVPVVDPSDCGPVRAYVIQNLIDHQSYAVTRHARPRSPVSTSRNQARAPRTQPVWSPPRRRSTQHGWRTWLDRQIRGGARPMLRRSGDHRDEEELEPTSIISPRHAGSVCAAAAHSEAAPKG